MILEYEKPEFLDLVIAVENLMVEGEEIFFRRAFRWVNANNEVQKWFKFQKVTFLLI